MKSMRDAKQPLENTHAARVATQRREGSISCSLPTLGDVVSVEG